MHFIRGECVGNRILYRHVVRLMVLCRFNFNFKFQRKQHAAPPGAYHGSGFKRPLAEVEG